MLKTLFKSSLTTVFILFFITACAEEDQQANAPSNKADQQVNASANKADQHSQSGGNVNEVQTIMGEPVDFSTADAVEQSLQKIAEQGGEKSRRAVETAMQYITYYDLSLGGDKAKLYKKLDGKTPNQIIAMMKK